MCFFGICIWIFGCTCAFDYYLCRLMDFNSWVIKRSFIFFFFYYFGKTGYDQFFRENIVPNRKN